MTDLSKTTFGKGFLRFSLSLVMCYYVYVLIFAVPFLPWYLAIPLGLIFVFVLFCMLWVLGDHT